MLLEHIAEPDSPSPGSLVLNAAHKIRNLEWNSIQKEAFQSDLRQARRSVQLVFDFLAGLENTCQNFETIHLNIWWFCYTLYVQVLDDTWTSLSSLFEKLSSARQGRLVQLGEEWALSMTELLVDLQVTAATAMPFQLWDCFDLAMLSVPLDLRKGPENATDFQQAIVLALTGENPHGLASPWAEIGEQLRNRSRPKNSGSAHR